MSTGVSAQERSTPSWTAVYKGDLVGWRAGSEQGATALDLLSLIGEAPLGQGLRGRVHIENTSGGEPGRDIGLVRGVNNSEVSRQRLRLYELWAEARLGEAASVLAGFYDFNSEFNATPAAGLFIAPGFGISSEISGAWPGGPSIFPSTGLGARGRIEFGEGGYVQAAAINADVGVAGDPGGFQLAFDNGVLAALEGGVDTGAGRLSAGVWRYSDALEEAPGETVQGVYGMWERRLGDETSPVTAFARAGLSDGRTGDFSGGGQGGVVVSPAFAHRPDSAIGLAVDHVRFSDRYRRLRTEAGLASARGETGLELTYQDRLGPHLLVQPDLQLVWNPEGDPSRQIATVLSVRFTVHFNSR